MIIRITYMMVLLVVALFGIINIRKMNILFRLLTFYVLYTLISENVSLIASYIWLNNSLILKIYLCVEITFMCGIYYFLFRHSKQKKLIIFFSALLFLSCITFFIVDREALLPGYPLTLESTMFIVFSVMYFFQLLKYPYEHDLLSMGEFWLNSSVLVYSTGSFVFWVSFYYLFRHHIILPALPEIMNALDILHYALLGLAIFFHVKRKSIIVHETTNR